MYLVSLLILLILDRLHSSLGLEAVTKFGQLGLLLILSQGSDLVC